MAVDLLDFVMRCKRVAKQALGRHAGEPATGGFARWVHVTIHCLRIEEDCTYREVVNRLQYNAAVYDVLGIYATRADRAVETLKATALVDTASQAVLDVQCTTTWRHDTVLGPQVARRNAGDLLSLSADKGFDDAAF